MTGKPTDDDAGDAGDEGPITPEVVRRGRGAAARKRRPLGEPPAPAHEHGPSEPARPSTGNIFRIGCILLIVLGLLELFGALRVVFNPDQARCESARSQIDAANDDSKDFNDVSLPDGANDARDVRCADAIDLAGNIPESEGDEPDGSFPAASAFRTQGVIFSVLGVGHGVTGFLVLRTRRRPFRTAALVFVALGVLLPLLGIFSLAIAVFAVYALVFSADAKAIFGTGGGRGFLRPRVPPRSA